MPNLTRSLSRQILRIFLLKILKYLSPQKVIKLKNKKIRMNILLQINNSEAHDKIINKLNMNE